MAARLPSRPVDPRVEALRVPPHSIDAEQAVLGALMLDPQALEKVVGVLSHTDFYRRDHQLIFKAISELAEKNRPYDAVTLGEALRVHDNDWTKALDLYQRSRVARTARIVLSSREMGRIYHAKGVERLVRNDLWRGRSAERFYDAMEWLYGWNVSNCLATPY